MAEPLLRVSGLRKHFPVTAGLWKKTAGWIKAVDGVTFHIDPGETFGLVGESGCGKTTIGRLLLRLIEPTAGEATFRLDDAAIDLIALRGKPLRQFRRHMQLVFQDPFSSLNPRMTVFDIIAEPLKAARFGTRKDIQDRVKWLTEAVGLKVEFLRRYPHAFSGGQRQRICIARALALNPKLVICDEPVSALDVSVQSQVLNLMMDLQRDLGLSYLFIAHDLAVVRHVSDRVAIMYLGKIMELADADSIYRNPRHAYTKALISAIPVPDPAVEREVRLLEGDVPSPINPPKGCAFGHRMGHEKWEQSVGTNLSLREVAPGHWVQPCPCCTDVE